VVVSLERILEVGVLKDIRSVPLLSGFLVAMSFTSVAPVFAASEGASLPSTFGTLQLPVNNARI
jgi:hypothetical protein